MPVVTAAMTPDTPIALAGMNAMYALSSDIATLSCASSIRLRNSPTSHPTASPIAMPPIAPPTNRRPASASEKLPPMTTATATRYATSAVASLKRPSPSMLLSSRRGTPSRRITTAAASGSVGDTIAPSANAADHGIPSMSACATTATAAIVMSTRPTELSVRARKFARMSPKLEKNAAPYRSGGRKTTSTTSGSRCSSGTPGTRPNSAPPITSTIGYGTSSRCASAVRPTTATRRPTIRSSVPCNVWLATRQQRHALDVRGLREHVDRAHLPQRVAGVRHLARVRRQRGGIARDVDHLLGLRLDDASHDLLRQAGPRRVDHDHVGLPSLFHERAHRRAHVAREETRVVDAVQARVLDRVGDRGLDHLDAPHLARAPGDRDRDRPDAAEEVEDALAPGEA